MAREFAKAFYNSPLWKDTREYILKRDNYLCCKCSHPAEEVHHIIHLTPNNICDVNVSINPSNLISLCRECHFAEHRGDHGKGRQVREDNQMREYEFDENGYLVEKKI